MAYKKGECGNPSGRPKGAKNRKTIIMEELARDGSALAAAIKIKALEGDASCLALWLSRLEPPLRARAERVVFEFNPEAPLLDQFNQVMQAVADGSLSVDDGKDVVQMLRARAEIVALEGGDAAAARLVERFKDIAQVLASNGDNLPPIEE